MSFLKNLFKPRAVKSRPVDIKKRFELIGRVGQGSMSKVWRARDTVSGKIRRIELREATMHDGSREFREEDHR